MRRKAYGNNSEEKKGVNGMSFKNPDRLKKDKNKTKKFTQKSKTSTKTVIAKKPK
jgi:hypothetical protein